MVTFCFLLLVLFIKDDTVITVFSLVKDMINFYKISVDVLAKYTLYLNDIKLVIV